MSIGMSILFFCLCFGIFLIGFKILLRGLDVFYYNHMAITIGFILMMTGFLGICMYPEITYEIEIKEVVKDAESIDFYIDGEQVDYKCIDIRQYDVSYDEENGNVYLTRK